MPLDVHSISKCNAWLTVTLDNAHTLSDSQTEESTTNLECVPGDLRLDHSTHLSPENWATRSVLR